MCACFQHLCFSLVCVCVCLPLLQSHPDRGSSEIAAFRAQHAGFASSLIKSREAHAIVRLLFVVLPVEYPSRGGASVPVHAAESPAAPGVCWLPVPLSVCLCLCATESEVTLLLPVYACLLACLPALFAVTYFDTCIN